MEPTLISQVVGANVQRIRTQNGVTTEQLARTAARHGLKWTDSRVSAMENGKVSPTLPTLIAAAMALGEVTSEPVHLADLVEHVGLVRLNDHLTVDGQHLVRMLSGESAALELEDLTDDRKESLIQSAIDAGPTQRDTFRKLHALEHAHGRFDDELRSRATDLAGGAEERAARDLGIDVWLLVGAAAIVWGRPFSEERDRRAGPDANAQKRGRVTREMKAELRAALDEVNHGDD